MRKLQNVFLTMLVFSVIFCSEVCLAADDATVSITQIESAAQNVQTDAGKNAYAKILRVYDSPQKLRESGKLDNAVKVSRKAYLDYLAETEALYRRQNVSAAQVLNDLKNLRLMWDIADCLGREQYGQSYLDFELLNARHSTVSLAGDILAKSDVKLTDAPILKDAFCVTAAMKVLEGEIGHLKKSNGQNEEILNKEIELLMYYSSLGYDTEAIELGKRILPQAKKIFAADREKILSVMSILGEEYAMRGNFTDSDKQINERISYIAQNPIDKKSDARDTMAAQNDLIQIYFMQDKHQEGTKLLNDVLPNIDTLPNDDYLKGLLMLSLCAALDSQGSYDKADALWRSMPKNDAVREAGIRVRSDMTRNKIYYGLALANDLMLTMTDSIHWGNNYHGTLYDFCNVSDDYLKMGNVSDAIFIAKRAEQLSRERYGKLHPVTIRAKMALAAARRRAGDNDAALAIDTEARKNSQALYGKNAAPTLKAGLALADDYAAMGKSAEAQKLYEDNIISYRQNYGASDTELPWSAINRLAALCLDKGNRHEALKLCNHIITTKRNFQAHLSPEDTYTLLNMARAYRMSGDLPNAIKYYNETLLSYENVRRNAILTDEYLAEWFADIVPVYKEQMLTYFQSQKPASEILHLSDLCKARNLSDRYSEYLAVERSGIDDTDKTALLAYAEKTATLNDALNSARQEDNDDLILSLETQKLWALLNEHNFKAALAQKYPTYKKMREISLADASAFSDKLEAIPRGAYFIDYSLLPDKILISLAQHGEVIDVCPVAIDNNFLLQCEIYREILSAHDPKDFQDKYGYLHKLPDDGYEVWETIHEAGLVTSEQEFHAAREKLAKSLGDVLLAPLAQYLPSAGANIIISPDGVLSNIPFETLAYKNGILIDGVDVSYVPSLSVLQLMHNHGNAEVVKRKDLFAVGAVDYGRYMADSTAKDKGLHLRRGNERAAVIAEMGNFKWDFLPGTDKEVHNVAALFPGRSNVLKGRQASERNLKELDKRGELKNYRYLLFSTHGLYVPPQPELSAILLKPDDTQSNGRYEYNGYITVGEWMGYHLNSDLVYLSACESGLGKFQAGEGVVGIPYGLTVAGNKSTVMSLWNIGDKFAADFTTAFFSKLAQGKTPKAALNETKREFMTDRRYGDPSIWSAFLLYGE